MHLAWAWANPHTAHKMLSSAHAASQKSQTGGLSLPLSTRSLAHECFSSSGGPWQATWPDTLQQESARRIGGGRHRIHADTITSPRSTRIEQARESLCSIINAFSTGLTWQWQWSVPPNTCHRTCCSRSCSPSSQNRQLQAQ